MPLWQKAVGLSPIIHADELKGSGIDELMHEIMFEWEHKSRGYESVIRSNIIKIFIWTLRHRCPSIDASDDLPESLYIAMQPAFEAAQKAAILPGDLGPYTAMGLAVCSPVLSLVASAW